MRGIIQLAILESVVSRVGHEIPIQELFDVVVGTGTGISYSNLDFLDRH